MQHNATFFCDNNYSHLDSSAVVFSKGMITSRLEKVNILGHFLYCSVMKKHVRVRNSFCQPRLLRNAFQAKVMPDRLNYNSTIHV